MGGRRKHTGEVGDGVTVAVVFLDNGGLEEVGCNGGRDEESGMPTVCAWCLVEQGIAPDPADSHGICPSHRAVVWQAYCERKTR